MEMPKSKKGFFNSQKAFGIIDTDANEGISDKKKIYTES